MKSVISLSLILSFASSLMLPLNPAFSLEIQPTNKNESFIAERGGGRSGGTRSGGGGRSVNRSVNRGGSTIKRSSVGANGSGRVNRSNTASRSEGQRNNNRENLNLNDQRTGSNRVNRDQARDRTQNINRDQARDRTQNTDRDIRNQLDNANRDQVRNRVDNSQDFNLDNDRRYSNRINRNNINIGNRNVIVNPRPGWGGWGWNNGVVWRPNYGYWGGGFWGGFAVGAVTTGITAAIVSAANQPDYIIIEQNSPGYQLFDGYGLTQVPCVETEDLVFIYGPQDSLICATPNGVVSAGYYDVDPEGLVLIAR